MEGLDAHRFLTRLPGQRFVSDQMADVRDLPAREALSEPVPEDLDPGLRAALARGGVTSLYSHQASAIRAIRGGRSVVVVTGTASGKTLCYTVPVLQSVCEDPLSTALFLFPTKALAQDQLRGIERYSGDIDFFAGTYDGDTPQNLRRKLRDRAQVLLTNPDMLHQGILPNHARWNRFFSRLRHIVVDEIHAYRGVFGSHLANVMRRLARICRHYGSDPVHVCCSATIANPGEHASRICGVPVERVDRDGSPRGRKHFVMWNPPRLDAAVLAKRDDFRAGGDRRSPLWEAVKLLAALVSEGIQTIVFTRTRLEAELVAKNTRDLLAPVSRNLASKVHAYRGGYLPEERRELERRLAERDLLGVASTNALELGIDIGSLDACVLLGYPGTIASLWQQAGRAGRGQSESLVFLVARNTPVDQFLMAHADWVFGRSPERAMVDPDNPHVTVGHLQCAAHELPLGTGEAESFGALSPQVLELLEEDRVVRRIGDRWFYADARYPASQVSLRNIAGPVYTIEDIDRRGRVIGTVDELSAFSQLYTHAVYLHGGESWFVEDLDPEQKIVRVSRREVDYFTQSVQASKIRIDETEEESEGPGGLTGFGDVTVTTEIPMFKKVRFRSRESVGFEKLELPPQCVETVAMWWAPPADLLREMERCGLPAGDALVGLANLVVEVAPVFVMCDPQDIGAVADSSQLGREALFVHDRFPGGMGYARGCLDHFPEILQTALSVIRECACEDGCPSCVGSAVPSFAMTDLDTAVRGRIPDKGAARFLLEEACADAQRPRPQAVAR